MSLSQSTSFTVSEITSQIKAQLSESFSDCCIRGEISDFSLAPSGHIYFSLKDAQAKLSAVIWRSTAQRLPFDLKNGLEVLCHGGIEVYPPRGSYQLIVRKVEPLGAGSLQLAFQQQRARLEAMGWFAPQRKRGLPRIPQRIGLVTSPHSAAVRDFLQVIQRRWPQLEITICPTRVQGTGAAQEIAAAIGQANRILPSLDLIVLCRGGGSLEDLWCFNEMPVCQAVYSSRLPVVTGIGHEVDVTLADLIADQRALTPTEAAERIVPDAAEIQGQLGDIQRRLLRSLQTKWSHAKALLASAASRPVFARPLERVQRQQTRLAEAIQQLTQVLRRRWEMAQRDVEHAASRPVMMRPLDSLRLHTLRLDDLESQMRNRMTQHLNAAANRIAHGAQQLESLSPLAVLSRGYSVTQLATGEILRDVNQVAVDDSIITRLPQGKLVSRVTEIVSSNGNDGSSRQD